MKEFSRRSLFGMIAAAFAAPKGHLTAAHLKRWFRVEERVYADIPYYQVSGCAGMYMGISRAKYPGAFSGPSNLALKTSRSLPYNP